MAETDKDAIREYVAALVATWAPPTAEQLDYVAARLATPSTTTLAAA